MNSLLPSILTFKTSEDTPLDKSVHGGIQPHSQRTSRKLYVISLRCRTPTEATMSAHHHRQAHKRTRYPPLIKPT